MADAELESYRITAYLSRSIQLRKKTCSVQVYGIQSFLGGELRLYGIFLRYWWLYKIPPQIWITRYGVKKAGLGAKIACVEDSAFVSFDEEPVKYTKSYRSSPLKPVQNIKTRT